MMMSTQPSLSRRDSPQDHERPSPDRGLSAFVGPGSGADIGTLAESVFSGRRKEDVRLTISDLPATVRRRRELPTPPVCKQIREQARITIPELSAAVGISESSMMAYESGRRQPRGVNRDRYVEALRAMRGDA
jgi:hypothetical protein